MLLDTLRLELKQLLADARCEEVFQCLRGDILKSQHCELYDDAVLLENRYREAQRAGNLNVIDFKEKGINFSNVSQALLWLINRISESDLSERRRKQIADHVFLPDFHAFTCDRFEQRDQFELAYWTNTDPRIRCFYLYGDARQEHSGLFASLGYKLGGFLENWENGEYNPGIRIKFARVKPEVRRHPMLYQIDLTKALFARFFPSLSDKTPLQNRTVRDLLGPGSDLQHFGKDDLVFILLTMDARNWNKDLTPLVLETFIEKFLGTSLPETAPGFFFFFGVEYEKGQETKKAEVQTAIANRQQGGEALDPLEPVHPDDITDWFDCYRSFLVPPGLTPDEQRRRFFATDVPLDMLDIQPVLLKIIELYNKGLAIRADNLR